MPEPGYLQWRLGRLLTRRFDGVPILLGVVTIRPEDSLGAVRVREARARHRDPRFCWVEIVNLGGLDDA